MRKQIYFLVPAAFFVTILFGLSQKWGPLPPLGPFLSFYEGVFSQYRKENTHTFTLSHKELSHPVEVIVDSNLVPHIFAKTKKDLYFAQGFVTAKYRLWQMDMTTRVAGGQLSEILGEKTKDIDRFFLSLGLKEASKQALELMMKDEQTALALQAYTQGVNTYIADLNYLNWPLEYKIMHFKPKAFETIRVAQLIKIMSFNLSGRSYDLAFTEVLQKLGWKKSIDLFPDYFGKLQNGTSLDDFFLDSNGHASNQPLLKYDPYISLIQEFPDFLLPFQNDGSNSWIIGAEKTESKAIIFSNDTHLGLKAPPVWFENRLNVQSEGEEVDVYGASFPGTPGVVLGFNKNFAWGATNGTVDVLDWYEVEFEDENSDNYLLDGKWTAAKVWNEEYKVRGEMNHAVTKIIWTEFGPILHREGKLGLAVRWTAHEQSNELSVFLKLNEVSSVNAAVDVLKDYKNPIQNFSLADTKNFGIYTAGLIPMRKAGQGRSVENGRLSKNKWQGFLSVADNPKSINPSAHYLHSANQRPAGSRFPTHLGWDFEEAFRGLRIREHLENPKPIRSEESKLMQNDGFNKLADLFFKIVDREPIAKGLDSEMIEWDFMDRANSEAPSIFYAWIRELEKHFWGSTLSFQKKKFFPKKSRTLIELEKLKIKDQRAFETLLIETYAQAVKSLGDKKKWKDVQPTEIKHVTSFPGLDAGLFYPDGSRYSLNSNKGNHGGAWRFVIEMSDPPKAWTQIPGSNNGDPLSSSYTRDIPDWVKGNFKPVSLDAREKIVRVVE